MITPETMSDCAIVCLRVNTLKMLHFIVAQDKNEIRIWYLR